MKLKIILWSVRGLNEKEKRLREKNYLGGIGADLVCLQETKLNGVDMRIIRSLWG